MTREREAAFFRAAKVAKGNRRSLGCARDDERVRRRDRGIPRPRIGTRGTGRHWLGTSCRLSRVENRGWVLSPLRAWPVIGRIPRVASAAEGGGLHPGLTSSLPPGAGALAQLDFHFLCWIRGFAEIRDDECVRRRGHGIPRPRIGTWGTRRRKMGNRG